MGRGGERKRRREGEGERYPSTGEIITTSANQIAEIPPRYKNVVLYSPDPLSSSLMPRLLPAHARRRGLVSQVGLAPEMWSD